MPTRITVGGKVGVGVRLRARSGVCALRDGARVRVYAHFKDAPAQISYFGSPAHTHGTYRT